MDGLTFVLVTTVFVYAMITFYLLGMAFPTVAINRTAPLQSPWRSMKLLKSLLL
jgi:hypothetical protein